MTPIAHPSHWITTVAYFVPVAAFLVWLGVVQYKERRGRGPTESSRGRSER
ncbi:MAG TPA: hypothetical protein VFQ12_12120 [Thermoleophilaceae bacterium]|nr:hypothetical protein [Thermoleophilaceae bacterium]